MEFVTGHAGTDHISAADMAALYRGLLTSDNVVLDSGNKLSCTMLDANTAEIGTGDFMFQGHHCRVEVAEQLTIQSGSIGFNRNDIIVPRYTLGNDGTQACYFAVIQGTAVAGDASDPSYTSGDIDGGDILVEEPMWRIPIRGITVETPERIMPTVDTLQSQITSVRESVAQLITTEVRWSSAITVGAGSSIMTDVDVSKDGYTPLGIVGFRAMNNGFHLFLAYYEVRDAATIRLIVRSAAGSSIDDYLLITVLYEKS